MINIQDNNRHPITASHHITQCENECHKNCSAIYSFHDKSFFLATSSDIYSFTYFSVHCAMSVNEMQTNTWRWWNGRKKIDRKHLKTHHRSLFYDSSISKEDSFRSLVLLYWDYIFWQREIISSIFIFLLHKKYWEVSTEK